jgi:hypothetical protein
MLESFIIPLWLQFLLCFYSFFKNKFLPDCVLYGFEILFSFVLAPSGRSTVLFEAKSVTGDNRNPAFEETSFYIIFGVKSLTKTNKTIQFFIHVTSIR